MESEKEDAILMRDYWKNRAERLLQE